MTNQEAYAVGFSKIAEAHGVDPVELYDFSRVLASVKQASINKQARFGTMARIIAKLSPKVDPSKLNWFTRLFTDSHTAIAKSNKVKYLPPRHGFGYGTASSEVAKDFTTGKLPDVTRTVTRISPLKILAGATAAGGIGGLAKSRFDKENNSGGMAGAVDGVTDAKNSIVSLVKNLSPEQKRNLAIALGIGTAGLAGLGIAGALYKSRHM